MLTRSRKCFDLRLCSIIKFQHIFDVDSIFDVDLGVGANAGTFVITSFLWKLALLRSFVFFGIMFWKEPRKKWNGRHSPQCYHCLFLLFYVADIFLTWSLFCWIIQICFQWESGDIYINVWRFTMQIGLQMTQNRGLACMWSFSWITLQLKVQSASTTL